jgi:hypothetical protein
MRLLRRFRLLLPLLLLLAAALGSAPLASAQSGRTPNGVFLVATPALVDPNFRHSVVLVTQAPDGSTVGFIVNRPGRRSLAQILPGNEVMKRFTEPLYLGGPVEGAHSRCSAPGIRQARCVLDDVSFAWTPPWWKSCCTLRRSGALNGYSAGRGQLAAEYAAAGTCSTPTRNRVSQ